MNQPHSQVISCTPRPAHLPCALGLPLLSIPSCVWHSVSLLLVFNEHQTRVLFSTSFVQVNVHRMNYGTLDAKLEMKARHLAR